jgi:hypothetical protein
VKTMAKSDPADMLKYVGTPYLGDSQSYEQFVNGQIPAPTSGSLHNELAVELAQLPPGLVLDRRTDLLWSQDVKGGSGEYGLAPMGPGVPSCHVQYVTEVTCFPAPSYFLAEPQNKYGSQLETIGGGARDDWQLPTFDQLQGLLKGWQPSLGTARSWLEAAAGSDAKTCTPTAAGSGEAISNPNTCIWPTNLYYWSSDVTDLKQEIHEIFDARLLRTYTVGYAIKFENLGSGASVSCFLYTPKIDWSDLGSGPFEPFGTSKTYPENTSCGGYLAVVRKLPAADAAKYYFPI